MQSSRSCACQAAAAQQQAGAQAAQWRVPPPSTVAPPFDAAAVAALPPSRQGGPVAPYSRIDGPAAWAPGDFRGAEEWTVELSQRHIGELEACVRAVLATGRVREAGDDLQGLTDITTADLGPGLPTLGPLLREVGREVAEGRGFALLRRLPVERWGRAEVLTAYWILSLHWGVTMTQNEKGHVIGHVKDVGVDPDNKNPNTRIYMTRAAQPWHVDSADLVALLCLQEAKEGGDSAWASSVSVLNAIREEAPELLPVLAGPWFLDRKGEVRPGQEPGFEQPILSYYEGRALVAFHDSYYQTAALKFGGRAALSEEQERALAAFRSAADRLALRARLAPGDVQLLNNHTQVHARSAYRDWEDAPGSKRHLLRLWVALPPPSAPPLPAGYRHLWREFAAPGRGLTPRPGGGWVSPVKGRVPLEAEVGQANIPPPPTPQPAKAAAAAAAPATGAAAGPQQR